MFYNGYISSKRRIAPEQRIIMVLGFICFVAFMLIVGILALVFVSFDAAPQTKKVLTQHFPAVRKINTSTIETVDEAGHTQQWQRLS